MAQLGGKTVRTILTALELLSDDGEHVMMIGSNDGVGGGGVRFRIRRPWDSSWGGDFPTFTVGARDAGVVAKAIANEDASYIRTQLDEVDGSSFRRDDPTPAAEKSEQEQRDYEARCTELDIERARAANIQQEFILDHSRDKHITADVEGCPTCAAKVIPSVMPESSPLDRLRDAVDDADGDGEDLPF